MMKKKRHEIARKPRAKGAKPKTPQQPDKCSRPRPVAAPRIELLDWRGDLL